MQMIGNTDIELPDRICTSEYTRTFNTGSIELSKSDAFMVYAMLLAIDVSQTTGVQANLVWDFIKKFIGQQPMLATEDQGISNVMFDRIYADTWYSRMHLQPKKYGCLKYENLEHYQKLMNDPKFHQLSIDEQLKAVDPSD